MRPNETFWVMRAELAAWRESDYGPLPAFLNRPAGDCVAVRVRIEEKNLRPRRHTNDQRRIQQPATLR